MSAPDDSVDVHLGLLGIRRADLGKPTIVRCLVAVLRYLGYGVLAPDELDRLDDRIRDACAQPTSRDEAMHWARVHGALTAFVSRTPGREAFGDPPDSRPVMAEITRGAVRDIEAARGG